MAKAIDLAGQRYERLVVVERAGVDKWGNAMWLCRCDCGNTTVVARSNLHSGGTRSCGCWQRDAIKKRCIKHGYSGRRAEHPLYRVWINVKARCLSEKHPRFKDYGGRGIGIHEPWIESFETFFVDVGHLYVPGLTIDRIDNDGHYEPGNIRWATRSQQNKNQRKRKKK